MRLLIQLPCRRPARTAVVAALTVIGACRGVPGAPPSAAAFNATVTSDDAPPPPPARWLGLIGEYGPDAAVTIVLERDGRLWLHSAAGEVPLDEQNDGEFTSRQDARGLVFRRDMHLVASRLEVDGSVLERRRIGPASGNQLVITPVRPIADLRREALAAKPPVERGPFLPSDLVELTKLDSTIRLEIRYATSDNLFGTPFYTQARAFLQRPAADAVVRANARLRPLGYGLLVHDGYRPWYVTKMFWDATPEDKHIFVANPAEGSKHNRGAAVDLTLYELATGKPVEMVSTYDETSSRAYPDYPGGTSRQRWHRALLRRVMEAERFAVYEAEWWHFDFAEWRRYRIGTAVFEEIR
ncbi:MAG: M15 family metallopeptidase [Gemmatimonadota bacterium]|nr:M15 family metallopeptidase [Gemmatimonadota bacterium]